MQMPSPEEITSLIAQLNYTTMEAQSEAIALRATLHGYLKSKGERQDALDQIIAKGSATILALKLEQAEKMSPSAAAAIDMRTLEDMDLVNFDALQEIKKKNDPP